MCDVSVCDVSVCDVSVCVCINKPNVLPDLSLIPRPPPRYFFVCEIKSGWRPGDEATQTSGLREDSTEGLMLLPSMAAYSC